jgi:hypothetical protein
VIWHKNVKSKNQVCVIWTRVNTRSVQKRRGGTTQYISTYRHINISTRSRRLSSGTHLYIDFVWSDFWCERGLRGAFTILSLLFTLASLHVGMCFVFTYSVVAYSMIREPIEKDKGSLIWSLAAFTWTHLIRIEVEEQLNRNTIL